MKRVLSLAIATPADKLAPKLRTFVRESIDTDYPREQLYVDLARAQEALSDLGDEKREDAVLDVMDFLTGWCAPGARLY